MSKKPKTDSSVQFPQIEGWACHAKGEKLVKYTYTPAALLDNDVEVKVSHCGICGSDIHTIDNGWGSANYPCVVGHEIVGTVTAKGSQVAHLTVGDRVGVGAQCSACLEDDCHACRIGKDAHCPKMSWTYNNFRFQDGSKTHGGYAEAIRVQGDYVFKLPDAIPSELAAPLMCAGVTVFAPMLRYGIKKGDRLGVVGIGGLGHMAIKLGHALGCEVTAFSHSPNKRDEAMAMGAAHFVDTSDKDMLSQAANTLDFLIVASNARDNDFLMFNGWMKIEARIILVAIPEVDLKVHPRSLTRKDLSLCGSSIGSISDVKALLAFAAEHKVYPTIEKFPMSNVNEALLHVRSGKVRYRVVLEN